MKIKAGAILIFFSLTILGNFLFVPPAAAALELVKSKDFGTVYYLDSQGLRHPFPNETTYKSWYGSDFSRIVTVSNDFLYNYPLGKNITIRPGTYLVKVRTAPQVYAVEQGGVLREIQDEYIAEAIYGQAWPKRVVDIPDVFFENYQIGEPLIHDYQTPDSILYQDSVSKKYYYRNNGILQPFESVGAVLANRFDLSFALSRSRDFSIRTRPITELNKNVFNPVAEPITDKRDCENKKLKAAVIFLASEKYNGPEIETLQTIKDAISGRFTWVTDGLAEISFNYPTSVVIDDGYLIQQRNDGTIEVKNEVINTFYDNNPDIFDFIFVFTNFKIPTENTNEIAHFITVTNRVEGLNKAIADRSEVYGSTGKLKGIIMMGNINKYHPETQDGLDEALNVIMHEILHNWAAYIEFTDETGQKSQALLRNDDYSHWSNYAGFISPLGGFGWLDNNDGTFTNGLTKMANTNLRKYSKLDLYLMGLIPKQLMTEPIMYLEPKGPGATGNIIEATTKYVTIDQIIAASGQIKCSLD
ncbi:MAG: hypothetical protein WC675_04660 [Patescibacteria group bacterium]|jgi:hypothetical protein